MITNAPPGSDCHRALASVIDAWARLGSGVQISPCVLSLVAGKRQNQDCRIYGLSGSGDLHPKGSQSGQSVNPDNTGSDKLPKLGTREADRLLHSLSLVNYFCRLAGRAHNTNDGQGCSCE